MTPWVFLFVFGLRMELLLTEMEKMVKRSWIGEMKWAYLLNKASRYLSEMSRKYLSI